MSEHKKTDVIQETVATYDTISPDYCRKTRQEKYLRWEREYIQKLLTCLDSRSPVILDVGCGDGRHCRMIDELGGRAIGIDLSTTMLEEARRYYPAGDFRRMDMRLLEFESESIDGIWSSGSIYHVPKKKVGKVLSEFRRVLKPNGVLAISFKLGNGEGLEANPKSYGGSPRYFAYYSKDEMLDLMQQWDFIELDSCLYPEEVFGDNLQQMWLQRISGQ
jgi:SAM-dependent methyltransferase